VPSSDLKPISEPARSRHQMTSLFLRSLRVWVPIAVAVTLLSVLIFTLVQQDLRQTANDPQIQMAEDTAAALASGEPVASLVPSARVDIAASLSPFLIVYDNRGKVTASSATLDGKTPSLPAGVLTSARSSGQDQVTWEPRSGVRIAAVVVPVSTGGSVLAGRSLREIEIRESDLLGSTALAWLFILGAVAVTILGIEVLVERRRRDLR
jgi:hypothetical protein